MTTLFRDLSIRPFLHPAALAVVGLVAVAPVQSHAQACSEGKTASGQCVDAVVAAEARQDAIVFSQPKISATAAPVMPTADTRGLNPDPARPSPTGTPAPN